MTARECVAAARQAGDDYQRPINAFIDGFRAADEPSRAQLIEDSLATSGQLEGLVAAIVSALCRESGVPAPAWVGETGSREPFFPFPARSFEMRVRLMIESPPPFRIRRVFVPENYLSRA